MINYDKRPSLTNEDLKKKNDKEGDTPTTISDEDFEKTLKRK